MTFTHPENVIINQPQQTPPFTGRLLDVQLGDSSKAYIDQDGNVAIGMGSNAPAKIVSIGSPGPSGVAVHSLNNSWMGFQVHRGPLASDEKWFIGLGDTATYGNKLLLRRAASTNDIVIDENGNVGIATASPSAKLEVAGTILASITHPTAYQFLNGDKTEGVLIDTTNKAVRALTDNVYSLGAGAQRWSSLRVGTGDSSFEGRVGIGTVNPSEKLEVVGNIKASGNMNVSGLTDTGQLKVGGGFEREPVPEPNPPPPIKLGLDIDGNGNIGTNGNLQILRADEQYGGPTLIHLGRQGFQGGVPAHTNYFFWQSRTNRNGWYWSGWNTFRHRDTLKGSLDPYPPGQTPPTPQLEWGYGYYPFRNMAKNYLLEADGVITTDNAFIGPFLYFQDPLHADLIMGEDPPKGPLQESGYTPDDRRPYILL